jgi:ribosomal protein S18 acetylase RimI-like enzyme
MSVTVGSAGLRPYDFADTSPIVELSLSAWQPVFASLEAVLGPTLFRRLHPDWRDDQQRAVQEALASESMDTWVAVVDAAVAGFVTVALDPQRGLGEIYMITVDPRHQKRGIGADLTAFALEWITTAGMTVAVVETGGDPGHGPARRLYEGSGFYAPADRPILQDALNAERNCPSLIVFRAPG